MDVELFGHSDCRTVLNSWGWGMIEGALQFEREGGWVGMMQTGEVTELLVIIIKTNLLGNMDLYLDKNKQQPVELYLVPGIYNARPSTFMLWFNELFSDAKERVWRSHEHGWGSPIGKVWGCAQVCVFGTTIWPKLVDCQHSFGQMWNFNKLCWWHIQKWFINSCRELTYAPTYIIRSMS